MLADRVALMFDGVLQQVGQPDAFYRSPRTKRVAQFFRSSNFLTGVRNGSTVATSVGDIAIDPGHVPEGDGPVVLAVRPEDVEISSDNSGGENLVIGKVSSLIYMGSHTQLVAEVGGSIWHVQGSALLRAEEGDQIYLRLPRERVWIVEDDGVEPVAEGSVAV